jgi:hypothetical protein
MDAVSEQQTTPARPRQVTVACLIVMLGSVFVILLMWDRISNLHNLATRQALQSFVQRSDLHGAGVDVGGLLTTVKVLSMICAAFAVAMVVQGWHATTRSRSARLALTVLTVPLFLTALVGDGFVGSAAATFWASGVAAAVATLWLGPNRVWFGDPAPAQNPAQTPTAGRTDYAQAPFTYPTPAPPRQPDQAPPSAGSPTTWAPPPVSAYDVPGTHPARPPSARPRALLWACLLTWLCTGLAATGLAVSIAMMSSDSDSVMHDLYQRDPQLADQGLSQHAVLAMLYVISALVLVAAVAAAVFAILVFLRHHWAWYALIVSASGAALLFLIGSFGSPIAIVLLGASIATVACLVRPEVRSWLLRR